MLETITKIAPFKVFVRCNTYNQSLYIKEALNGFIMQKTSFPFVCMVMDDCSSDGEQDLLLEWAKEECVTDNIVDFEIEDSRVVFVRHKENTNCYFAFYLLKRNTWKEREVKNKMYEPWRDRCEYEALCEGDDYWTDPLKLQKQVDFMEVNQDCAMCFSNAKIRNDDNLDITFKEGSIEDREYSANEIMQEWCIPTASVLHRKAIIGIPVIKPERILFGDIIIFLASAKYGKIFGISDNLVVYRINGRGITQDKRRTLSVILNRPTHYEFIRDNFGDIVDNLWLSKQICKCYCERSIIENSLSLSISDLMKAFQSNKAITIRFIYNNYIKNKIKAAICQLISSTGISPVHK